MPTVTPSRRRGRRWHRRPAERPGQILAAASRVFAARGFHRTTLDDVARGAGITKGTIYLYYRSKEEVFAAMLRQKMAEAFAALEGGATGGAPDMRRRLERFARQAYAVLRNPATMAILQMIIAEARRFPETAEFFYRDIILKSNRRLAAVIRAGIAAGELRPLDPMVVARGYTGMFLAFALSQVLLGGARIYPVSDERVLRNLTAVFLDGVCRDGGAVATGRTPRARG